MVNENSEVNEVRSFADLSRLDWRYNLVIWMETISEYIKVLLNLSYYYCFVSKPGQPWVCSP